MGYHFSKDQRRGPKPGARNFLLSSWCDSSSEVGLKDWFYVLCNTCPRKVQSSKDKYWCEHCKKVEFNGAFKYVILWNSKAKAIVGKTTSKIKEASETNQGSCYAKALNAIIENKFLFKLSVTSRNIRSVDQAYNVVKLRDDESLIDLYGMQSLSIDNGSVSTLLGGSCNLETYSERNVLGNVSLSKHIRQLTQDSTTESFCKTGNATPTKPTGPAVVGNSAIVGVGSPEGQGSSKKIFRKGSGKWKME
ncbi:hypothetical protein AHAS_Ahas12G0138800 [Arachis hypogaea]